MCFLFNHLQELLDLSKPAGKPYVGNRNGTLRPTKKDSHNMKRFSILISSTALALAFVSQAGATSVTVGGAAVAGQGQQSSVAGAITTTFNGLTSLPAGFVAIGTTPSNPLVNPPDLANVYAAPTGDSSTYLTTGLGTIVDSAIPAGSTYFGFYWGSVDSFNNFQITDSNGKIFCINGSNLASLAPGVTANGTTSYFVNLYADAGATFKTASFSSTNYSFEFDNVATATPEPASIAMLAGGLLVVAGAVRRRKA